MVIDMGDFFVRPRWWLLRQSRSRTIPLRTRVFRRGAACNRNPQHPPSISS